MITLLTLLVLYWKYKTYLENKHDTDTENSEGKKYTWLLSINYLYTC